MKRLIFIGLMLFATPAFAEDVSVQTLCQMLPNYQPSNDVNYKPGVDVRGNYVAPADVNKVLNNNFDAVEIPVEYNVLNNLGVNLPAGSEMNAGVALLKVYGDGRVKYNGQDLSQQAQSLCSGMGQSIRASTSTATYNNVPVSSNGYAHAIGAGGQIIPNSNDYIAGQAPKTLGQLKTVPQKP